MKTSRLAILRGAGWTLSSYVASFSFRFAANVILSYLLAPEIFGAMVIVNTLRLGVELTSDLGLGHCIVQNKKGENSEFYNTAWTVQILRGVVLFAITVAAALPVANFYDVPILAIQISAISFIFVGATSLSLSLAVKRMSLASRNIFDAAVDFVSLLVQIALCYASPTIWSLVVGVVIGAIIRCVASFWLPAPKHRLVLCYAYVREILSFGKWIFVSSLVYFACTNIDRLYLAKVVPLAAIGVYGIARSISELPATLAVRLSHLLIFPLISTSPGPRVTVRRDLASVRILSLLVAAVALAIGVVISDVLIAAVYDRRYVEAGWMLPLLLIGVWGSVICSFNEAALLGLGKPIYGAIANSIKLAFLVVGLPLAFESYGITAAIVVIALSDVCRYVPLMLGQMRERFTFLLQDLVCTLMFAVLLAALLGLRSHMGWGNPLHGLPLGW